MIIARLKGGLGNQLFIYAAARGVASRHNVPLKFDTRSGGKRDSYRRGKSLLHHFNTNIETASLYQCYESVCGRVRRGLSRNICKCLPFKYRSYVTEPGKAKSFDERLLNTKPMCDVYLDGCWQSEKYFTHIETELRQELVIVAPHDAENIAFAEKMRNENAVCIHVRQLHGVGNITNPQPLPSIRSLGVDYYQESINYIVRRVKNPVFFIFSDYPPWVQKNIRISHPTVFVTHNSIAGETKNYEDLWLMTQCKHYIIANSTFSWWGAWLSDNAGKIVIAPDPDRWDFEHFSRSLILDKWIAL